MPDQPAQPAVRRPDDAAADVATLVKLGRVDPPPVPSPEPPPPIATPFVEPTEGAPPEGAG